MLKEMFGELIRSWTGRISIIMLAILGGAALYVAISFPGDFSGSVWNNPRHWADNPKSAPPLWVTWFDSGRARHYVFESSEPRAEQTDYGKEYTYLFRAGANGESPPTFLDFEVWDVSFGTVSPVLEVYLAGEKDELLLHRYVVPGLPSDSGSESVLRHSEVPYRVKLTADRDIKDKAEAFLASLAEGGEENYIVKISAKLADTSDDIGKVRFVVGGDAYGWLGTDNIGRDVFSGLLAGLVPALVVGLLPPFLATWLGAVMGGISGYFGGKRDTAIQFLIDVIMMLPILPLLIYLTFVFGPNLMFVVLIISLTGWIGLAKKLRPWIFQIRELGFITYLRASGFSSTRIILRHVLPQTLPIIFLYCAFMVSGAIITEAALSFIGLGDPSLATWGQMLSHGRDTGAIFLGYWWWVLPPGIAIVAVSLGLFLMFKSLERAAEPRLRREK